LCFVLGIAESHTRNASQPWSPPYNPQSIYPSNQIQNHFNYPPENLHSKWKNQDYQYQSQQYNGFNQRNISPNLYPSSKNFTDL
jgi:hypothetical protein